MNFSKEDEIEKTNSFDCYVGYPGSPRLERRSDGST